MRKAENSVSAAMLDKFILERGKMLEGVGEGSPPT